jgi:hypothetical protein
VLAEVGSAGAWPRSALRVLPEVAWTRCLIPRSTATCAATQLKVADARSPRPGPGTPSSAGVAGALRRIHPLLRDRRWRQGPRIRVLQGTPPSLEPQITIGLLADASGFPLMVEAFAANRAETTTMLPSIQAFMAAQRLATSRSCERGDDLRCQQEGDRGDRVVVPPRDAHPYIPYVISQWRREHPDEQMPNGLALTQPWAAGLAERRRDHVIYYQYEADRARGTLRGINEQVAKAARAGREGATQAQLIHHPRRRRQYAWSSGSVQALSGVPAWTKSRDAEGVAAG